MLARAEDPWTLRFETNEQIIDASATDRVPEVIFTYTDEAGT